MIMAEGDGRIYLSPPHMTGREETLVSDAFASNWVAPLGPHVDALEREFCQAIGAEYAVALSSGTAALHIALRLAGVGAGDEVLVSTLTFVASVNPILYLGATPVFVDSEPRSWNLDPTLLEAALEDSARRGRRPAAIIVVHLYGQVADMGAIMDLSRQYGVPVVEDAAEALGGSYHGCGAGTMGRFGAFSFNGNKIITTSGGGMLVCPDVDTAERARKLATQAREPTPHYEHNEVGYNYRLSNVLAAVGRAQLEVLEDRVAARRNNFDFYRAALGDLPGVRFMPEAPWGRHTRWLTVATIDPAALGVTRDDLRIALEVEQVETRPVWKPMHAQPLFRGCRSYGGSVSEALFAHGLCLPSGSSLSSADLERVVRLFRAVAGAPASG
jgi:dTDP-4-amino-4,6-dideoxygalactose transaminase